MQSLSDIDTHGAGDCVTAAQHPHDPHVDNVALSPVLFDWLCRMGDTTLILGQRLSEWCGHGPALEEDIALTNIALDLIGHTQLWLGLAGEVENTGRSADDLAYHRDAMTFGNILLVEMPGRDMAVTSMRQFLYDAFHYEQLIHLTESSSPRVAEIAAKALKEVSYHVERSTDLVIRLGDGSDESHRRMQDALDQLWSYTGDMFTGDEVDEAVADAGIAPRPEILRESWLSRVEAVLCEATLTIPERAFVHTGGKTGRHTEHLGYILAEMQFLQRAYPGASW